MSLSNADSLLSTLRGLVPTGTAAAASTPSAQQIKQAQETLRKLKLEMVQFNTTPPFSQDQLPDIRRVLSVQREMLEFACFLSLYSKDVNAFERYITQLKVVYNDFATFMPVSQQQAPLLGLYLLCLLSQNRIADFHTEYELMCHTVFCSTTGGNTGAASSVPPSPTARSLVSSSALLSSAHITFPVSLEQQLMEGAYNQVLSANQKAPLPIAKLFMDQLAETVRNKIADCSELTYESIAKDDLAKLLMMPAGAELDGFISGRGGWELKDGRVKFNRKEEGPAVEITAMKTIKQTLEYATELERIV